MKHQFNLQSTFFPAGDQPQVIDSLIQNLQKDEKHQVLLGVTGSGKTFTVANVIAQCQKPTLIISQNKTLAAQLYSEFKHFFPNNRVEYFVSYYDYYQPESYLPTTDTYIAKDSSVNDEIEKYRLSTTASLLERRDTIVIASVSCIYGLGSPDDIDSMTIKVEEGQEITRESLIIDLIEIQYKRNDVSPTRGEFSVTGDVIDVFFSFRDDVLRIEMWGDEIEGLSIRHPVSKNLEESLKKVRIFPASHFIAGKGRINSIVREVNDEMKERVKFFEDDNKLVEAQRIFQRTTYDMEMLKELGYCSGIENYSPIINQRKGQRPYTLLDFFPKDFLLIVDESHVTLPQFRGMYNADRSRKGSLVDYGFRLPSSLDNRPLNFDEFKEMTGQTIYVSATPADYELQLVDKPVELVVRPTGLLDPKLELRPLGNQIDDLMHEVKLRSDRNERVIVTCLSKKSAEDLSDYFNELGIKANYIHSSLDIIERIEVLKDLRSGKIDCVIGINLLREGMDLPEVSLVAILDADKEGFLRSKSALIQISGRAARNSNGMVILYADKKTQAIKDFISLSNKRRVRQQKYNEENNVVPKTTQRSQQVSLDFYKVKKDEDLNVAEEEGIYGMGLENLINKLYKDMIDASENLEFERAAQLRDKIKELKKN